MRDSSGAPARPRVLLIGYGNPGRLDDGLGPALAEAVEQEAPAGVTVDADYQLTVEDAGAAAAHDVVIFADASVDGEEPFFFKRLTPKGGLGFSSHSVQPEGVLALARDLFQAEPRAWALGIRGYDFNEFGERLSERARRNLQEALAFVLPLLHDGTLAEEEGGATPPPPKTKSNGEVR